MAFTQIEFYLLLLGILVPLYLVKHATFRKVVLLLASSYFYAFFDLRFLGLLYGIILATYGAGWGLRRIETPRVRKGLLVAGIVFNTGILFYFKYFNFFLESLGELFAGDDPAFGALRILAPIGVSFYAFRFISYLVDTYREGPLPDTSRERFLDFLVYGTFFPIIVSGPISRAGKFLPQLDNLDLSTHNLYQGLRLFVVGLFMKVFVADKVAYFVNYFYSNHQVFDTFTTWQAVLAYDLQIYCDFAGYSSMAIGLGKMMGLQIEKNFDFPYISKNFSDFWRRWHITLSEWIRDYLYIPLGGNRHGKGRKYVNLLVAMTLCGLWHGAAWTFVLWGFLHGLLLVGNHHWKEQALRNRTIERFPRVYTFVAWTWTFLAVSLCWVFFRAESIDQAFFIIGKLFMFDTTGVGWTHPFVAFILLASGLFHLLVVLKVRIVTVPLNSRLTPAVLLALIWLVIVFFPKEFQPFVYAQF